MGFHVAQLREHVTFGEVAIALCHAHRGMPEDPCQDVDVTP
jgi:hypothetical protein